MNLFNYIKNTVNDIGVKNVYHIIILIIVTIIMIICIWQLIISNIMKNIMKNAMSMTHTANKENFTHIIDRHQLTHRNNQPLRENYTKIITPNDIKKFR